MNKKVEIKRRQSLQDITIQEGGSMEALFTIALENNNISITDDKKYYLRNPEDIKDPKDIENLEDSEDIENPEDVPVDLTITTNTVANKRHVKYYAGHGIKPATGITDEEVDAILPDPDGIDYWMVAKDFTEENEIIKIQ